jgi:hypothetical protein
MHVALCDRLCLPLVLGLFVVAALILPVAPRIRRPASTLKRAMSGPNTSVSDAVWEDATATSIANARACLPMELQDFYYPNLTAATAGSTDPNSATECEQLVLYQMYEHLNTGFNVCRSLSCGVRLCASYLQDYATEQNLNPAAMPRLSLITTIAECQALIASIPSIARRAAIYADFRYLDAQGLQCLRKYTVFGNVPTYVT